MEYRNVKIYIHLGTDKESILYGIREDVTEEERSFYEAVDWSKILPDAAPNEVYEVTLSCYKK